MRKVTERIRSTLKESEYLRILVLRTIGNFLVLSSLFFIAKTLYLPVREEIRYFTDRITQKKYLIPDNLPSSEQSSIDSTLPTLRPKGFLAKALNLTPSEVLIPQDPEFSVIIPKIGANARVLPNIDASDQKIYLDALNKGVAHAAGTAFPGEGGHVYLFAHSTDYFWNVGSYNAVFYLLSKLEKADEIDLFYKGQRYLYQVINTTVVDPSQVDYLTRKSNKELLTLQTCWPPGTTLKRLLVIASRVVE